MDIAAASAVSSTSSEGEYAAPEAKPVDVARAAKPRWIEVALKKLDWLLLPGIGVAICIALWAIIAGHERRIETIDDFGDKMVKVQRVGISPDLPSPVETWQKSKLYIMEPFAKRG